MTQKEREGSKLSSSMHSKVTSLWSHLQLRSWCGTRFRHCFTLWWNVEGLHTSSKHRKELLTRHKSTVAGFLSRNFDWKGILFFDVAQFDGILKKISEFNNALLSDPKNLSVTELEISTLSAFVKILKDTSITLS